MVPAAFDTLAAARRLKAAGIKAEHAEAIAEVMGLYFNQPRRATAERFDAQSAKLHAANARLGGGKGKSAARRDAFQSTTRPEFPPRTETVRSGQWKDCLDVEVGVVWLAALITILACGFTLLYIN